LSWHGAGLLKGDGICATVMSNLGLERKLGQSGIKLWRAAVGDRYVLEEMRRTGCNLGGEQSGHIIMSDFATTGDGLLAALQVLALLAEKGRPLSEIGRVFEPLPQILKSVRFGGAAQPLDNPQVQQAIASGEAALNGKGRLLIRKSGTEPVIRVMGEGEDEALVSRVVADIVAAVQAAA
jgi:phosphoglucosamine mutase